MAVYVHAILVIPEARRSVSTAATSARRARNGPTRPARAAAVSRRAFTVNTTVATGQRQWDVAILHLRAWRLLRAGRHEEALQAFLQILAERDHVASMRDGAECLYKLARTQEALDLLDRAKHIEINNPFTLELEARIYEETGDFPRALAAARVATVRDPASWGLRHRLARILKALGRYSEAIEEAREAVRLDSAQFAALGTLVSLLLDTGELEEAEAPLAALRPLVVDGVQGHVADHLTARLLYLRGRLEEALSLVERQVRRRANLAASNTCNAPS